MTILSTVCTKLLSTNAHLGRRVAAHHFKVYICGSRNGIAILDSDKTLICLRNALHFIGSLIRKKGRSFFLKTNQIFFYEIMEEMASCINDSQWKIGAFLTNSYANPKKFRSRKKKINFGLNQQPDCVVILKADRKSSVILEADRSQIPIIALVDSTIPWESYKRITYPIPANDPIQFVYLFRHSITKTAERPAMVDRPRKGTRLTQWIFGQQNRNVSSLAEFCSELFSVIAPYLGTLSSEGEAAGSVPQPQGEGGAAVAAQVVSGAAAQVEVVRDTPAPQELAAPLPPVIHIPPSSYSLAQYSDIVASNPTFMSNVLFYNTGFYPPHSLPEASGSGHSLNPAGFEADTPTPPTTASSTHLPEKSILNKRIKEGYWDNKLVESSMRREKRLESLELKNFLSKVSAEPEYIELNYKILEYEIYNNSLLFNKCREVFRHHMPMLHQSTNLVNFDEEEMKLRDLLTSLLESQEKEYTIGNLWQLERDLRKPDRAESIVNSFLATKSKLGRKRRLG